MNRWVNGGIVGPAQKLRWVQRLSSRMDRIEPSKVIWTMIGMNGAVYLGWQYGQESWVQFRDPRLLDRMRTHWTASEEAIRQHRYYTLLTSTFSHQHLYHLGINMFVLHSIGTGVLEAIGTSRFLLLYTGAGVFASATAVAYRTFLKPRLEQTKYGHAKNERTLSLGASGSILALTSFFAFPKANFLMFFVIPMPAVACVGLFAAYDIYLASTLNNGRIDSAAHIGGAVYGVGYYFLRVRPLLKAGRWRF
ncbi:hypothetical protein BY458DRAFT_184151 [Sporodiniella umbellata]|nr:hypothetical protein BY458DRAFT_184151 [Sporodiniella umbellata]